VFRVRGCKRPIFANIPEIVCLAAGRYEEWKGVVRRGRTNDEGRERWGELEIAIAGTTHVGRIRKANQDAFDRFDDSQRGEILLVVADGMGGHRGGEVASRMAVGAIGKLYAEGEGDPSSRLKHAIERANFEIHKFASKDRTLKGMGTTVVALLLCQSGPSFVAHVGDSRLYRMRDGEFEPLTEDHSVVALLVRNGTITPEEVQDHPKRNQIMRSLGVRKDVEVDVAPLDLRPQDAYLLCSDGLNSMLADEDLKSIAERATDPHTVVAWMIDAANQAGGMDNVTAMVAQIHEPTSEIEPSSD
jgi:serine/threonine protein phosphatase PrpC